MYRVVFAVPQLLFERVDVLKQALRAETQSWRACYARYCNAKYRDLMNETFRFIGDVSKRLDRPVNDLTDVRLVVDTLCEFRLKEIDVDMTIAPIEVCLTVCVVGYFTISITLIYRQNVLTL